jgi:hypothetical protein
MGFNSGFKGLKMQEGTKPKSGILQPTAALRNNKEQSNC